MRTLGTTLLLVGLLGVAGCAPSTLEAPLVPNPVLLGPVDRVGGHRAGQDRTLGTIEGEASSSFSASRSGGVQTASAFHQGASAIAADVLATTQGRPERDVRIDEIPAGAYAFVGGGAAFASQWVGLKARVVEVPRGR
jgi:hypothetical protein